MIKKLTVENYALIESIDIDFPKGLIVITGETGAGKSILLGALSLLQGGKSDNSVFSNNLKNCVVEGEFELKGEEYRLRRVITPAGRSRFFVNDEPVTAAQLAKVSESLIDIHAQNRQLQLGDKSFQISVLDSFCSNGSLLSEYRAEYEKVTELTAAVEKLKKEQASYEADKEYQQFQLAKLEEASLQSGEIEELEQEEKLLSNAENIKATLGKVLQLLEGEEYSLSQAMKESSNSLSKISNLLPDALSLSKRLDSCRIEIRDIVDEVEMLSSKTEISPLRLEQIQERLSLLYSLLKRYQVNNIEELIGVREELREKLSQGEEWGENMEKLCNELKDSSLHLRELADKLSAKREKGALKLSEILEYEIKNLDLKNARFDIQVSKIGAPGIDGQDEIKFFFSTNPGDKLIEIQKVASGGELSRVMLCLKKVMGERENMPTMIFDEIDVGVSGRIADTMGDVLSQMGNSMQIIAITHLPQVASKGGTHLLVYKEFEKDNKAHTKIKFIDSKERIMEIARLLSGKITTPEAVENAKVLLGV